MGFSHPIHSRFSRPPSEFLEERAGAVQDDDTKRLEIIGFRGFAKSAMASLVLWSALWNRSAPEFQRSVDYATAAC
jgi:hypothetical protein